MPEYLRATGGNLLHIVDHRGAFCDYVPAKGWAEHEDRDRHRVTCRECDRRVLVAAAPREAERE